MTIYSGGGREMKPRAITAGVWGHLVAASDGGAGGYRSCNIPLRSTAQEDPPAHSPGKRKIDAELVRRSVCGPVRRDLATGKGEGVQWTSGREDFWSGVATERAQRRYGEVGVHLEGEQAWRSGTGEGEAGAKGF